MYIVIEGKDFGLNTEAAKQGFIQSATLEEPVCEDCGEYLTDVGVLDANKQLLCSEECGAVYKVLGK
jgi:formylmethanofuran dehydrogenase subunit E